MTAPTVEIGGRAGSGFVYAPALSAPDQTAALRTWVLTCPRQSPAWDQFGVSTVHLRDIPGVAPAKLRFAGASHEFLLIALDPRYPVRSSKDATRYLTPINASVQEADLTDDQAVALCDAPVRAALTGLLPAEPALSGGAQEPWTLAVRATAAHLRAGVHA